MKVYCVMAGHPDGSDYLVAVHSCPRRARRHLYNLKSHRDSQGTMYSLKEETVITDDDPLTPQEIEDVEDCLRRWKLKNP